LFFYKFYLYCWERIYMYTYLVNYTSTLPKPDPWQKSQSFEWLNSFVTILQVRYISTLLGHSPH
jgi:hypothetical protein